LYWKGYIVQERIYCTGKDILYWKGYIVLERIYCTGRTGKDEKIVEIKSLLPLSV